MLQVHNIHKAYRREPVLRGVSFELTPSHVLGLCGGNGAGKSTLIHILASILPPDQGTVQFMGVPLTQASRYRSQIGFVPQQIALSPNLTVKQNLAFWASIRGLTGNSKQAAMEEAAQMTNITGFWHKPVTRCSGGMARRANLAAGLIGLPRLLLLDEPTAGIDEENRDQILITVQALKQRGCTVVMVNHYAQELALICDRIITLKGGVGVETRHYGG